VTSHDMADIEKLCPRVILINKGKIAYDGSLADIRRSCNRECTLVVELANDPGGIEPPFGELVADDGPRKSIRFARSQGKVVELIGWLADRYEVSDVRIVEPEIEAIIRDIYERGLDRAMGRSGRADAQGARGQAPAV